jgi:cation:H+ antiporter
VAIGTSIPEIATCIAAARKGHGSLAVGDILGADILNISWIAGASACANPLVVQTKVIRFMFPSMLAIVVVTLAGLVWRRSMTRGLGAVLMCMYVVYMAAMVFLFPPGGGP